MGIGKLGTCTVKFCRGLFSDVKNGTKYVVKESKELFATRTKIGRRLRSGVHNAREAVKVKMQKLSDKSDDLLETIERRIDSKGLKVIKKLRSDREFMDKFERYYNARVRKQSPELNKLSTDEEVIQAYIETLGVGPTKAAQIVACKPEMIERIKQKYGPELGTKIAEALQRTKSRCLPTRTVEQAQEAVNTAFPGQNFVVEKLIGVASIGETYLVKRPDGSQAVLKMIKNGLTPEQLKMEEEIFCRFAKELADSPEEYAKMRGQLKSLYHDWAGELNFFTEMSNNKLLAQGAKRYKVADITDIAEDGSCIIMNKAGGIKMDELMEILEDYKANPSQFAQKYAKQIAENPFLANPEKVIQDLPNTLLKAFDEQFMFLNKGGQTIMHGDPHMGNFFITVDKHGKLIPEFIDTGNCVLRTGAQVKDDISFFSNYFVGNSKGVAEYLVKQSGYAAADKQKIINAMTEDIQENIFGKLHNVSKFSDVQQNLMTIMEKYGLQMAPENATAMKAQMQFFSAISSASRLTGDSFDIMPLMKDIPRASLSMIKSGINPCRAIKDALNFAYYNQTQAVGTAYQFTIKDVDRIVNNGAIDTFV